MDKIQTKILRVFLVAIHNHLYSFALRFLFLQTHATVSTLQLMCTVKVKGEKPDRKPYPLSYGLRNPCRNLKIMPRNLNEIVCHEFGFSSGFKVQHVQSDIPIGGLKKTEQFPRLSASSYSTESQAFSPVVRIGSPRPLTRKRVLPPLLVPRRGHTR